MFLLRPFLRLWRESVQAYRTIRAARLLILGVAVGVLTGVAAIGFFLAVEGLSHVFLHQWAGLELPAPAGETLFRNGGSATSRPWIVPVLTTLVGLVTGWLVTRYIPDSRQGGTDGTDTMIRIFHRQAGVMRPLVPLIRCSTAILTIASGGSAGREGPISQLGGGIGSWLAQKLRLSARERRILLLTGAAGGLGAIFRAPLGGALTAVEVIYREDFEAEALLPAVVSSVVAYSLFTLVFGTDPIFGIPRFSFNDPRELIFYLVLALFCALAGWFYVKTFQAIKFRVFEPLHLRIGTMWTMALGGLVMGVFGMVFPQVLSGGYGWLELAILGRLSLTMMLGIAVGKTLATSITLGSGMSGGMFAPALFVGGMSGGAVGSLASILYPGIVTHPGGYVLVGMAAFFAGVANAPIGPMIMVCELTQGYGLLAPLMLASSVCLVVNRKISLYENQSDSRFDSPAHAEDMTTNVLEGLQVKDHFQPGRVTVMPEGMRFKDILDTLTTTNELCFPVVNATGRITGILAVQDLRRVLFEEHLCDLLLARDVARMPALLRPEDDLYTALLRFVDTGYGQIPVVDPEDETRILGLLARDDVFRAYKMSLQQMKEDGNPV